jgi:hypothetical protein
MIKRRSKVAKLPKEMQHQVNTMLDEGATYQSIVDWLASKGFSDFTVDCLYQWKEGGFQDWLANQQRLEQTHGLRQWATQVAMKNDLATVHAAFVYFAFTQLKELVDNIDALKARESLSDHPEHYARLFNSIARLAKLALDMETTDKLFQLRQEQLDHPEEDKPKAVSDATVEKIEKRLNLM